MLHRMRLNINDVLSEWNKKHDLSIQRLKTEKILQLSFPRLIN